jgi:hypothetical protein
MTPLSTAEVRVPSLGYEPAGTAVQAVLPTLSAK